MCSIRPLALNLTMAVSLICIELWEAEPSSLAPSVSHASSVRYSRRRVFLPAMLRSSPQEKIHHFCSPFLSLRCIQVPKHGTVSYCDQVLPMEVSRYRFQQINLIEKTGNVHV